MKAQANTNQTKVNAEMKPAPMANKSSQGSLKYYIKGGNNR